MDFQFKGTASYTYMKVQKAHLLKPNLNLGEAIPVSIVRHTYNIPVQKSEPLIGA